jgi:hypothetical protein
VVFDIRGVGADIVRTIPKKIVLILVPRSVTARAAPSPVVNWNG